MGSEEQIYANLLRPLLSFVLAVLCFFFLPQIYNGMLEPLSVEIKESLTETVCICIFSFSK